MVLRYKQGLAVEKDEISRGVSSHPLYEAGSLTSGVQAQRSTSVDFRQFVYTIAKHLHCLVLLILRNVLIYSSNKVCSISLGEGETASPR